MQQEPTPAETSPVKPARLSVRRVVDLLVIGLFGFALISLGWKLTAKDDSPGEEQLAGENNRVLGKPINWDKSISLRWGDTPFALTRERLYGEEEAVVSRLGEMMQSQMATAVIAKSRTAAEAGFLKRLAERSPILEAKGRWRIDAVAGPVILLAGTRLDAAEPRVVCWGFGLPDRNGWWTLMLFRHSKEPAVPAGGWPRWELPAGARIFLELRTPGGGGLMGLSMSGRRDAVAAVINQLLEKQGWQLVGEWRKTPGGLSARYTRSQGPGHIEIALRSRSDRSQNLLLRFLPNK